MAEPKTHQTSASVKTFIDSVDDPAKRRDCRTVMKMMREITGQRAAMWGDSIVGFGRYHYRYASGREGDWFLAGFSPRKRDLTTYVMAGCGRYESLMKSLGKHKTGKSCLYLKGLDDIDLDVLRELLGLSVEQVRRENI